MFLLSLLLHICSLMSLLGIAAYQKKLSLLAQFFFFLGGISLSMLVAAPALRINTTHLVLLLSALVVTALWFLLALFASYARLQTLREENSEFKRMFGVLPKNTA